MESLKAFGIKSELLFDTLADEVFRNIVNRTPVLTGFAKASWHFEKEGRGKYRIWNTAHYIVYLEFGYSRKAPQGMVRISLLEFDENLKKGIINLPLG